MLVAGMGCVDDATEPLAGDLASDAQDTANAADAPTDAGAVEDAAVQDASDAFACDVAVDIALPERLPEAVLVGENVVLEAPPGGRLEAGLVEDGEALATADGLEIQFDTAGRKRVEVLLFEPCEDRFVGSRIYSVAVLDTPPAAPRAQSSSIAFSPDGAQLAVVSEDGGTVALVRADALNPAGWGDADVPLEPRYVEACARPVQLAWSERMVAITCPDQDAVVLVDPERDAVVATHTFEWGARPWGVMHRSDGWWVTLQGTGEVARLTDTDVEPGQALGVAERFAAVRDARAIADVGDGTLLVTRWRASNAGNEVVRLDPSTGEVRAIALPRVDVPSSDTETGGVPTFVQSVAVSSREPRAYVVGVLSNVGEGLRRSGEPLVQDTTLRAVLITLDLEQGVELVDAREVYDDRGFAAAIALSPASDFAYLAMRGARTIERYDLLTGTEAGSRVDVGFAPTGIAVEASSRTFAVDVSLSREVAGYDSGAWSGADGGGPLWRLASVTAEPLSPVLLEGKRLFNDSADPRLTQDAYIACAHCHLDGDHDGLTWDFSDRGEGLRDTISLLGRGGMAHGLLHWSANFNEIQDFEHDLRGPFGGRGLMEDAAFEAGRDTPFGEDKAGASAALDALAAYVSSLTRYPRSPFRAADGSLSAAAVRGRTLFESPALGCTTCHSGAVLTDSGLEPDGTPRVHDVGTLRASSGDRLGAALVGLDTPTLHGLFDGAPYLHDGSAATLREVLTVRNPEDRHGVTSQLDDNALDDLVAYLLSLDGRRE